MRVLKAKSSSLYVWKFIQLNKSRAVIFLTLFFLAVMLFLINIRPYASFGLVMIPLSYILGFYAYRSYVVWSSGPQGERMVLDELNKLGDDYVLIRNAVVPPSRGDIDYILIGLNGIFVLETKNVGGVVFCDGDRWGRYKVGKHGKIYELEAGNPSKQAKRSAKTLKDFILKHGAEIFNKRVPHIWVYSILVFTNKNIKLSLRNPTIDVLSVEELNDFVLKKKDITLSKNVVNNIANAISKNIL